MPENCIFSKQWWLKSLKSQQQLWILWINCGITFFVFSCLLGSSIHIFSFYTLMDAPRLQRPPDTQQDIPTKTYVAEINKNNTEFLAQRYKNRIFLVITQCNSFGSIINITKDDDTDLVMNHESDIPLSFKFLLGVEDNVYKVLAKKIGELVFREVNVPITMTLALKDKSSETLRMIMDSLQEIDVWSFFKWNYGFRIHSASKHVRFCWKQYVIKAHSHTRNFDKYADFYFYSVKRDWGVLDARYLESVLEYSGRFLKLRKKVKINFNVIIDNYYLRSFFDKQGEDRYR